MIPESLINELKEKADIVSIVSSYVAVKKKGKNYLGLCPFHSEKTPSFVVSQEKSMFHCFGCGAGGNVFTFVMKMENTDFLQAAEIIGDKIGVHIERSAYDEKNREQKNHLYALAEAACEFFELNIDGANEYIKKRGIADPKLFRLGFAPNSWDAISKYLLSRGAKLEDLLKLGLIIPRPNAQGYYDRFRDRLIFPITDHRNRVVGFSGRALNNEEPKYLNSPDSEIFVKGDNLYNLGLAKDAIKQQKFALVVEGNVDVISIYEAGIKNVIAPLGTAFTPRQAKLIKRFSDMVVLAFDADPAGVAATERAQEILKEADVRIRIAQLKDAKDPDEMIKRSGKEAFIESVKASCPALEFKLRRVIGRFNLNEAEARARAAHEASAILSDEKDKILQSEYIKLASQLIGISAELLEGEVKSKYSFYRARSSLRRTTAKPSSKVIEAQKKLIRLMIEWDEATVRIKDELQLENFGRYEELAKKIFESPANVVLENLANTDEGKILREIMLSEEPLEDRELILSDCINSLKAEAIKNKMEALRNAFSDSEKKGGAEAIASMNKEYLGLNEIFRSLAR
ncbi:DNA primase [Candidatus Saganbacteria bacterium]|nr:DNA primase [Candidatus Saganbacteria bacterium]